MNVRAIRRFHYAKKVHRSGEIVTVQSAHDASILLLGKFVECLPESESDSTVKRVRVRKRREASQEPHSTSEVVSAAQQTDDDPAQSDQDVSPEPAA